MKLITTAWLAISTIACTFGTAGHLSAQTIFPVDRARFLVGSRLDVKIEFQGVVTADKIKLLINGADAAGVLGKQGQLIEREDGAERSSLVFRDVSLAKPGRYTVEAGDGTLSRQVIWEVYDTPEPRRAKNVILFIGDGLSNAHRVAARVLSQGIREGKYNGRLALDTMPATALVATSGVDSIITDSANSMHAYTTGHKSSTNALGVYVSRSRSNTDHPRVETITSLVQRRLGMAVGIVTNTEIEDATPAAMVAHTRRRADYNTIVQQMFEARPDVILGGGSANFLPKSTPGSRRNDEEDYIGKFRAAGYEYVATATELAALSAKPDTTKLLGLFNSGNMDGVLDRRFLKGGSVKKFPDQPDLTDQVRAALSILAKNDKGFFLMVESGLIDKYTHALDMERAVYDTIMLDNAVKIARDFAAPRNDTLILVLADHTHPIGIVGVMHDDMQGALPNAPLRERLGVYAQAGYPNYPAPDAQGYPDRVDVSRRLAIFSASIPDYYETFRPKLDGPNAPSLAGEGEGAASRANPKYADAPGALLVRGNLPSNANSDVHSAEDSLLSAAGPGSERVQGFLDNTEVFEVMARALALGKTP